MLTSLPSNFYEKQWLEQIRETLEYELEEDIEAPVTIFGVPKALMNSDSHSYTPQQVAIGPYHHSRLELYDMDRYKVAAAKRNQKDLENVKLQDLVDRLMELDLQIRACYDMPLSFGREAFAWMMAIDVFFLFEFLQVCGDKKDKVLDKIPSGLAYSIDSSGNKTVHNTILRDIFMLENQIPLFVMRELLQMQFSSPESADETLLAVLIGLSKHLSPFKTVECPQKLTAHEPAHLLDFLYNSIVPKTDQVPCATPQIAIDFEEDEDQEKGVEKKEDASADTSLLRGLLIVIWRILSSVAKGPVNWIKGIIFSRPALLILKLTKIPILKVLIVPIVNIFSAFYKDKEKKEEEGSSSNSNNVHKIPLQDEIAIPSVTQLFQAGVQFSPTKDGISSISFAVKTLTFYIPVIKLDVNSEVVLRNLVAYEACSVSGPLFLTRYTELMNGIIDTDVDAKFLCRKGIIINHLKSEKEVADLWNGMSKSVRLTKVPSLDNVIEDVNKFYRARWKVKIEKFMMQYVFASWKILTFLAAIAMLLLMCLQAFCQVYSCSRIIPIKALEPANTY